VLYLYDILSDQLVFLASDENGFMQFEALDTFSTPTFFWLNYVKSYFTMKKIMFIFFQNEKGRHLCSFLGRQPSVGQSNQSWSGLHSFSDTSSSLARE